MRPVQITVSIAASLLALVHIVWPNLTIDAVTVTLVIIAVVPWLVPLFKSLELPGGWKVEFRDLERTKVRAEEVGLLDARHKLGAITHKYSFEIVANGDPNLALAGLQTEIDRYVRDLAEASGVGYKEMSLSALLRGLGVVGTLTPDQVGVLRDLIKILNACAHGRVANRQVAEWAIDIGPDLLNTLGGKIEEAKRDRRKRPTE